MFVVLVFLILTAWNLDIFGNADVLAGSNHFAVLVIFTQSSSAPDVRYPGGIPNVIRVLIPLIFKFIHFQVLPLSKKSLAMLIGKSAGFG